MDRDCIVLSLGDSLKNNSLPTKLINLPTPCLKKKPWTPNETFFFCGRPKEKLTNVQDALFRAITMNGNRLLKC